MHAIEQESSGTARLIGAPSAVVQPGISPMPVMDSIQYTSQIVRKAHALEGQLKDLTFTPTKCHVIVGETPFPAVCVHIEPTRYYTVEDLCMVASNQRPHNDTICLQQQTQYR